MVTFKVRHFTIILGLIFTIGLSITNAQRIDTSNVYYQALKLHLDYLIHSTYVSIDTNNIRPCIPSIPTTYCIEHNYYTTNSLPDKISDFNIEILTSQDIYHRTKNKKAIYLIAVRPAQWENGRLMIYVIDFAVTRKRKHFYYSNGGGSSFQIIGRSDDKLELKIIQQGGNYK